MNRVLIFFVEISKSQKNDFSWDFREGHIVVYVYCKVSYLVACTAMVQSTMLSKFPFYNNNNLLHVYSTFLDTQSALHSKGGGSPHPPPVCSIHPDDETQPQCTRTPPHTPATGGEETVMKTISVWG